MHFSFGVTLLLVWIGMPHAQAMEYSATEYGPDVGKRHHCKGVKADHVVEGGAPDRFGYPIQTLSQYMAYPDDFPFVTVALTKPKFIYKTVVKHGRKQTVKVGETPRTELTCQDGNPIVNGRFMRLMITSNDSAKNKKFFPISVLAWTGDMGGVVKSKSIDIPLSCAENPDVKGKDVPKFTNGSSFKFSYECMPESYVPSAIKGASLSKLREFARPLRDRMNKELNNERYKGAKHKTPAQGAYDADAVKPEGTLAPAADRGV